MLSGLWFVVSLFLLSSFFLSFFFVVVVDLLSVETCDGFGVVASLHHDNSRSSETPQTHIS